MSVKPMWTHTSADAINSVDISASGAEIVVGNENWEVLTFNTAITALKQPILNYTSDELIRAVAISSDGNYFAAGNDDDDLHLFQWGGTSPLWTADVGGKPEAIDLTTDGSNIAVAAKDRVRYFE